MTNPEYDYVVVGSGAGGGTVAARLVEAGASAIVLEAGGDPRGLSGGDAAQPQRNDLPYDYDVPAFHVLACENDAIKWDFPVRHYADETQQARDPKYGVMPGSGNAVLYPRAGTLGGCTAHNAMIFVYPHDQDWQGIADLTRDLSWAPQRMRGYFERLERCTYRPDQRLLHLLKINPSRHGFGGWLNVELPRLSARTFFEVMEPIWPELVREFGIDGDQLRKLRWLAEAGLDANDWQLVGENSVGLRSVPLTTRNHRRVGTRERLLDVRQRYPDRLDVELNALATKVLFDGADRAIGVEYLSGEGLYRAGRRGPGDGETKRVTARREVILAGGAFNTPQLLMLSGIGPAEHLRARGIAVRAELAGVGGNLQDRYEVGVVNRMRQPWNFFAGATFSKGDPQFREWNANATGVYTTNGAALSFSRRSPFAQEAPDLFCMLIMGEFKGYYPGFSRTVTRRLDSMTWVVLKAHTHNRAGTVRLRSNDPRDTPIIDFNYFTEGEREDLGAMVDGVKCVRRLGESLAREGIMVEELPGPDIQSDAQIAAFVRDNAWGHHASCSCPIGDPREGGVVSSDFKVHGVTGLRVVDASVFPRIPGFFIASATYMIAEKAADVILADAPAVAVSKGA